MAGKCSGSERRSGEKRKKRGEKRGYRHLLDSDKWTEISIGEWNHHWLWPSSFSRTRPAHVMGELTSRCVATLSLCLCLGLRTHTGYTGTPEPVASLTERSTCAYTPLTNGMFSGTHRVRINAGTTRTHFETVKHDNRPTTGSCFSGFASTMVSFRYFRYFYYRTR